MNFQHIFNTMMCSPFGPTEYCAGIVLYRQRQEEENGGEHIDFLLMQDRHDKWGPAKGHLEHGETSKQAAIRETAEETGILAESYEIVDGFEHQIEYTLRKHCNQKVITYFIARITDANVQVSLSREHRDFRWVQPKEALRLTTVAGGHSYLFNRLLRQAWEFLKANDNNQPIIAVVEENDGIAMLMEADVKPDKNETTVSSATSSSDQTLVNEMH